MKIVHLPFYDDNPYQALLMQAQRDLGHEVVQGGGGGNFIGVALRQWKADIMHFHWLHPYLLRPGTTASICRSTRFLAEVAALKARGTRIAWTIHNLVNHDGLHPKIDQGYSALFAKLANACFVHSKAAAEVASRQFSIPSHKLHVIPHGHYKDYYPNEIDRIDARSRLELPANAKVFLFLGRIEPYKGVIDLIAAFRTLPQDCILVIAGKVAREDLVGEIQQSIGADQRIHLHPRRIEDHELQLFFNAADAVVFPFRKILTSGSMILAMSFGKAVVAPRLPALEEILPESGVSWFSPEDLAGSLPAAMMHWVREDTRPGERANLLATRDWHWHRIANDITTACGLPTDQRTSRELELPH